MDARKRARATTVAGLIADAMPTGSDARITPGSGPTLGEAVALILAVEAVTMVKGDAGAAAASALAHVKSGRAQAIVDAISRPSKNRRDLHKKDLFRDADLTVRATADIMQLSIRTTSAGRMGVKCEKLILSHAEDRCILQGDDRPTIDMDRLRAHMRVLAEEVHRRDDRGMTVEEMYEHILGRSKAVETSDYVRLDLAGVDWNVTGMHRDQVNHQSIEAWRLQVRSGINQSKLTMKPKAHVIDRAIALVARINAELVRQGRLPEAYHEVVEGSVRVGTPVLTERLTVKNRAYHSEYGARSIEDELKRQAKMHAELTAMLRGRAPASTPEEVPLDHWRFDPVLLRLAVKHSQDPEDALRRIVFGPHDAYYQNDGNPLGPDAPAFHTRVARLEATVRVVIADGIAWSNGSATVDIRKVAIPEQLVGAMKGRRLGEVVSHPLLDADAEIVNATVAHGRNGKGTVTIQTRRRLVAADEIIRPLPLAA